MIATNKFSHSQKCSNFPCENSQGKKITYTYDSMNRRVARTDEKGTTQYLYGNPNHPFQLTAVRSPSGSLSRYHYDDFGLLFALERDNNWYYITTDQLGTPRVVCNANGELVKVLEYDSFGQVIADCYPEFELHISFAGGLIDIDTELVRFGFRDYDAVAGKWTAKDPIGFLGSDSNLYRYVGNDSINYLDSSGLKENPVIEAIAQTGGPCCGADHDCWQQARSGKCSVNSSQQNQICIEHDYLLHQLAIKTGDRDIWQKTYRPDVMAIHQYGCNFSTNLAVKTALCHLVEQGQKQQLQMQKELQRQRQLEIQYRQQEELIKSTDGVGVHLVP